MFAIDGFYIWQTITIYNHLPMDSMDSEGHPDDQRHTSAAASLGAPRTQREMASGDPRAGGYGTMGIYPWLLKIIRVNHYNLVNMSLVYPL